MRTCARVTSGSPLPRRFSLLVFCLLVLSGGFFRDTQAQSVPSNLQMEVADLRAQAAAHPSDIQIQMLLAARLVDVLDVDAAIRIYAEVLQAHPENLTATIELCTLYTMTRQHDLAISTCQGWTSLDANNYNAHDNLGLSYFKFGEPLAALKPFTRALALQPESAMVDNHLGLTFLALREFASARDLFLEAVARRELSDEEKAYLYHGLYLAYNGLRQPDEALAAIYQTYDLSGNPLYFGKVVAAFIRAHQGIFFILLCTAVLLASSYFGKRLNRFLKNED